MALTPVLTSYSFDSVACSVNGIPMDGFMEGTAIEITREDDAWTYEKGNDGKVCRSKMLASVYKVQFTLMQSSLSNDVLSGLHLLDYNAKTPNLLMLTISTVPQGHSVFVSNQSWISRAADMTYDRVVTARVWTFTAVPQMSEGSWFVGGNS